MKIGVNILYIYIWFISFFYEQVKVKDQYDVSALGVLLYIS